jgi:positive regulator of sigma E activity
MSPDKPKSIDHCGVVQKTAAGSVHVLITAETACSGCHSRGACGLSGKEQKVIEVQGHHDVKPGDIVTVSMRQTAGFMAVSLGYVIPLLTVMAALIILISAGVSEPAAGGISLVLLVPYYAVLYLFRKRINGKFVFTLN